MDARTPGRASRPAAWLGLLLTNVLLAGCGGSATATPPGTTSSVAGLPLASATPALRATPSPAPNTAIATSPSTSSPSSGASTYVVIAGDTLWKIAQRNGRTVDELFAANPQLTDRALVRPGDTIIIPSDALHENWKTMVVGRDAVSRAGITMSGTVVDVTAETLGEDGRVRFAVRMDGLPPSEAVTLSSVGRYEITWACRDDLPVGTGPVPDLNPDGMHWSASKHLGGTARTTTRAVAASDGSVSLTIDLVPAHPVDGTCPDPRSPWFRLGTSWEPVTITDAAHGLRLTPEPVVTGP